MDREYWGAFCAGSFPERLLPERNVELSCGLCPTPEQWLVFSTLVDADWLETEQYMEGSNELRGQHASIEKLTKQFNQFLAGFEKPLTAINEKRTETLRACIDQAKLETGFFTLTVPTGGGKTYASMAFALNHALNSSSLDWYLW